MTRPPFRAKPSTFWQTLYELLSSMRFAITLLVVLALASIIGTVLNQNEPYLNYITTFGFFWFQAFKALGLLNVYHTPWFLSILLFLIISIGLCIYRHSPQLVREMKGFRERAKLVSIQQMHHSTVFAGDHRDEANTLQTWLQQHGFKFKVVVHENALLIAAKKGAWQRSGYWFTHVAILLICFGGLLDGSLPLQAQLWLGLKHAETRPLLDKDVPSASRLDPSNLSFRANTMVSEGESTRTASIGHDNGYLVQDLPFDLQLNRFTVEHYSSGQPKLFASDVTVTKHKTGEKIHARLSVNHPLIVDGIAIYQSSFGDGGSPLSFKVWRLDGQMSTPETLKAVSKNSKAWQGQSLEMDEFRPFNIEDLNTAVSSQGMFADTMRVKAAKSKKNVGPSIRFKIRDNQGQAKEYLNYMLPITLDGQSYAVSGVRTSISEDMLFVRIPLTDGKIDRFMALQSQLLQASTRDALAQTTVDRVLPDSKLKQAERVRFQQSMVLVLQQFADNGFAGLESFLTTQVPADKRAAVAATYFKMLQAAASTANANGGQAMPADKADRFVIDSLLAINALRDYGSPVYFQLTDFTEVKASGFQLTRAPGELWVYLGSVMLIIGAFIMFYMREQRLWLWLGKDEAWFAMTSQRQSFWLTEAFAEHKKTLADLLATPQTTMPTVSDSHPHSPSKESLS